MNATNSNQLVRKLSFVFDKTESITDGWNNESNDNNKKWGLVQKETKGKFHAHWDEITFFHDAFTHYFETIYPFNDKYAFNIAGEIAALGHAAYFIDAGIFPNRGPIGMAVLGLLDLSKEANKFGGNIITQIKDENLNWKGDKQILDYLLKNEEELFPKLKTLLTWGYNKARKFITNNNYNKTILRNFIDQFKFFINYNEPEKLAQYCEGIDIEITGGEKVSWKARLIKNRENSLIVSCPAEYEGNGFIREK